MINVLNSMLVLVKSTHIVISMSDLNAREFSAYQKGFEDGVRTAEKMNRNASEPTIKSTATAVKKAVIKPFKH